MEYIRPNEDTVSTIRAIMGVNSDTVETIIYKVKDNRWYINIISVDLGLISYLSSSILYINISAFIYNIDSSIWVDRSNRHGWWLVILTGT